MIDSDDWDAPSTYDPECEPYRPRCHCAGCESEGWHAQTRDCLYWQECDPEAGRHGDRCACPADLTR